MEEQKSYKQGPRVLDKYIDAKDGDEVELVTGQKVTVTVGGQGFTYELDGEYYWSQIENRITGRLMSELAPNFVSQDYIIRDEIDENEANLPKTPRD